MRASLLPLCIAREKGAAATSQVMQEARQQNRSLEISGQSIARGVSALATIIKSNPEREKDIKNEHDAAIMDEISYAQAHTQSRASLASRLGVDRRKIPAVSARFACSATLTERYAIVRMLDCIADGVIRDGGKCLALIEHPQYDEMQLPSRVKSQFQEIVRLAGGEAVPIDQRRFCLLPATETMPLFTRASADKGRTKLLNTEWRYAALFFLNGEYVSLLVQPCGSWLQAMARTTGEVYYDCLKSTVLDLSGVRPKFLATLRMPLNDSDASVSKAERGHERADPSQAFLGLKCVVHKAVKISEAALKQVPRYITGATNTMLVIHVGNNLKLLRDEVRREWRENLVFEDTGQPSGCARREVRDRLDLFLPYYWRRCRIRRAVLLSLIHEVRTVNGRTFVVHYEELCGCCPDREHCLRKLMFSATSAILPRAPRQFPGRNWVNNEDAIDILGLMELYGVLRKPFGRMMRSLGTSSAEALLSDSEWVSHSAQMLLDDTRAAAAADTAADGDASAGGQEVCKAFFTV